MRARRGEAVVMGAPNVVRGGSHLGWASAAPLAERGLVTVLASDYHWPAMLEAPFAMAARGGWTWRRPGRWSRPTRRGGGAGGPRAAAGAARRRGGGGPGGRAPVATFRPEISLWLSPAGASRLG